MHGVGWFGKPLPKTSPDALTPLAPLFEAPPEDANVLSTLLVAAFSQFGLTGDDMQRIVELANEQTAQSARESFAENLHRLRGWSHSKRDKPFRESKASTNLLTFGQPKGELAKALATLRGRFTPAQYLGAYFSVHIVFAQTMKPALDWAFDFLRPMFESAKMGAPPP